MEYRFLGSGDRLPMVGFGTWDVRGRAGVRTLVEALDVGYRLIDTAHMYGNERVVGESLRVSGVPREDVFVTTKLDRPYAGFQKALVGCDHSLRELGLDYVDLLLIHEPYAQARNMWRALVELREEGKARHIGVSNFQGRFLEDFLSWCDAEGLPQPELDQIEAHVYWTQAQTRAVLEQRGILVQAWAPFTEGRRRIFSEPTLVEVGERSGKTAAQVALRYLLQLGVAVVPKSSHRQRMAENLDVFDFELDADDMARIARLDGGRSLFGWY
ncbi:MAG: aldo/keto reductase [Atopobiaceae bacterium]|nr:aldo/keto reductase [Atopobiaceae bacterium]MBR1829778.1 aldo/keto reductase [Atopobiaceae bacterium]